MESGRNAGVAVIPISCDKTIIRGNYGDSTVLQQMGQVLLHLVNEVHGFLTAAPIKSDLVSVFLSE